MSAMTMKELIDRVNGENPEFAKLESHTSSSSAIWKFGRHIEVRVVHSCWREEWNVGVNWASLGTVNPKVTTDFIQSLNSAQQLANSIEEVLNKRFET
jgi:hypothetical protein